MKKNVIIFLCGFLSSTTIIISAFLILNPIYKGYRSDAALMMGSSSFDKKEYIPAISYLTLSIDNKPDNHSSHFLLAKCFEELKRYDLALEMYETAYNIVNDSLEKGKIEKVYEFDRDKIKIDMEELKKKLSK